MGRRTRYRSYSNNYRNQARYEGGISLTDFRFYNKKQQVINSDILNEIENDILTNTEKERFWTNELFWKQGVCFGFFFNERREWEGNDQVESKEVLIRIIEFNNANSTPITDINSACLVLKPFVISFIPNVEQQAFIKEIKDRLPKHEVPMVFDKWKDVVDFTIENDLFETDCENWSEFEEDVKITLNHTFNDREFNVVSKSDLYRSTCRFIYDVIERRIKDVNYRIALCRGFSRYAKYYHIKVYKENSEEYNYIDKDRIYFIENINGKDKHYFLDNGLLETNNNGILIHLDMYAIMMRNLRNILGLERNIITSQIYRFYRDRFSTSLYSNIETNETEIMIIEKYQKVLDSGREIKIGDVIISNKKIEVEGQAFCMKFNKEFFNTSKKIGALRKMIKSEDIKYNFNLLYENIIKESVLRIVQMDYTTTADYKKFERATFIINDKLIKIEKLKNRIRINGTYCRIDDIYEVLNRAICFGTLDDYNKYVKDVSFVGHEWVKLISTGVQINLANPFARLMRSIDSYGGSELNLRFSFSWNPNKRSEVFLLINSQKYLIKNKMKFKRKFSLPKLTMNMSELKKGLIESIPELNDDLVIEIVENAIAEGEIIYKRAKELVENTVKDIQAVETEIEVNGVKMYGYLFKGRVSGSDYFVKKADLNVYKKVNGIWNRRCVVNDHTKQRIFEDWLANRLVNVYNEPLYIFTLHNI